MKKVIIAAVFLLSMFGFSKNGVWEIKGNSANPKVRVIFAGDNTDLSKTDDQDNPSGIFVDYLDSSVTMGDGTDLKIVESKYKISDLKPGNVKTDTLNPADSPELTAVISKNYDGTLMGLFHSDAYKDMKIYNKGNKTIINYINLYFVFDKGDADFKDASGWN
jgi:hypothetical protein